jgi:hypothetical protein
MKLTVMYLYSLRLEGGLGFYIGFFEGRQERTAEELMKTLDRHTSQKIMSGKLLRAKVWDEENPNQTPLITAFPLSEN